MTKQFHSVACRSSVEADGARIIAREHGARFQVVPMAEAEHSLVLVECQSTAQVVRRWIRRERDR